MNLSDKIKYSTNYPNNGKSGRLHVKDVRETICELFDEFSPKNNSREFSQEEIKEIINKKFGKKLTEEAKG